MATYVYKAYDQRGHKKTGTLNVINPQEAHLALRERGLKVYFIADLNKIKEAARHKRRVRSTLIYTGGVLITLAALGAGLMIGYAGRAKPLSTTDYQRAGLVTTGSGNVIADTEAGEELARDIYTAWESFAPRVISGIEVRKGVMTIHVSQRVRRMSQEDLEHLAVNSLRALHRQTGSPAATLLVLENDLTILDVRLNGVTNSTQITRYT